MPGKGPPSQPELRELFERAGVARMQGEDMRREFKRLFVQARSARTRFAALQADPNFERRFRLAALNLLEDAEAARREHDTAQRDRALAQAEAQAAGERYRMLFESIGEGFAIVARVRGEFRVAECNPAFERHLQCDDAVDRCVAQLMRDEPAAHEICERVLATGRSAYFEMQPASGDRWLSVSVSTVTLGGERRLALIIVDITGRKGAELAVRASEEQLRRAIEEAPIPVIMHAEDGEVLQISRTWTELTGYAKEEMATFEAWLNQAYGEGAERVRDHVQRLFEGYAAVLDTEIDVTTRSGQKRRWAFSASAPGQLRDGRRFIVGMALDITARTHAEEALRASQERLRLILENAREYAIVSLDLERRVTSWNTGAEAITGYAAEEVLGRTGDIIFTPEERAAGVPEQEARTAMTMERASDERWHLRRDGSRFWGSGVMTAMRDAAGNAVGLLKIFRDQTEQLRAKEALQESRQRLTDALEETERARAEAESANRTKDHFFAVLSHELRTPLTPIVFATDLLGLRGDLPSDVREIVAMIRRNVYLEARFVDDLLDVTRVARGKLEVKREPMDLHAALRQALEVARPDFDAKKQHLDVSLAAANHEVDGDFMRLQQVFWNVLKNASKFTPPGGRISVATRNADGRIFVEVSDTGIGIEPEALASVFDPFTQADTGISRQYGGLGLGLAIAKASVEAHEGQLRAESEGPGHGATFTVSLPLRT